MNGVQVLGAEGGTNVSVRVTAQAPAGAGVRVLPGWQSRGAEGGTNVTEKN